MAEVVPPRFYPLGVNRGVMSPYGPRDDGFHDGVDYERRGGFDGDAVAVYSAQAGTVLFSGEAQGYGGPSPCGWLVIDHPAEAGSGCTEYGHIICAVEVGAVVEAGQLIGHMNPDEATNGGVPQHLHFCVMPGAYDPATKIDPEPWLDGAQEP